MTLLPVAEAHVPPGAVLKSCAPQTNHLSCSVSMSKAWMRCASKRLVKVRPRFVLAKRNLKRPKGREPTAVDGYEGVGTFA